MRERKSETAENTTSDIIGVTTYGKSQQQCPTYKWGVVHPVGAIEQSKDRVDWIAWHSKGSTHFARQVLCQYQLLGTRDRNSAGRNGLIYLILEVLFINELGIRRRDVDQHIWSGVNRRVELYRRVPVGAIE